MKLTVTTFVTLDGVMQAPGGVQEDLSGGFKYGGWLVPFSDSDMGRIITDIFEQADAILFGRKTYDMMYAYWPNVTDPTNLVAKALNSLPKYVATRHAGSLAWHNSHPLQGDYADAIRALKLQPGRELQVHGSHGLVQLLLREGLIDQFNIWTYPVLVGAGKRLFGSPEISATLRLLSSEVTSTGVIVGRYEPAGPVKADQSFAFKDGKETFA